MAPPTAYVSSATGTQGGAVARQLRALGWGVHATTRNTTSAAALALSAIGVRVSRGDWDDKAALAASLAGCQKVFLNLFPDLQNPTRETQQAEAILDLAKAAGVTQVVYSSVFPARPGGAGDNDLIARVRAGKAAIERAVLASGLAAATVLQPGFFMANFLLPKGAFYFPGVSETGLFTVAFHPDTQLPLTDHEDIARFVVAAFQDPERFGGETVRLASEVVEFQKVVRLLAEATGRNIRATYLSDEEARAQTATNPMLGSQITARGMVELLDLEKVRSWGIPLGSFAEFLGREKAGVEETYRGPK